MGEYGKKLTEAHCEQIKNMSADGKTYQDIKAFFWSTYKIKLEKKQMRHQMNSSLTSARLIANSPRNSF